MIDDTQSQQLLLNLLQIMDRLRGPDGCPWDKEQTNITLKPYILEEAYEVIEAIEEGDPDKIQEELGDLFFQIVFQARIAKEKKEFTFGDILNGISEKMIRRHPHVFGDRKVLYSDISIISRLLFNLF